MTKVDEICKRAYPLEIVEDKDEGGFVAYYPDLNGCITCGETVEDAFAAAQDAKRAWVEDMLERGMPIPMPSSNANKTTSASQSVQGQVTLFKCNSERRVLSVEGIVGAVGA
jgi:predicted RNase H-like HicB family nuclease